MPGKPVDVDAFIAALDHPQRPAIAELRRIILEADPRIGEQIKWNAPSFGYAGADRVTMRLQPGDRLQLIFHRGAKVRDSAGFQFEDGSGLMEWVAPDRAVLTLRDLEDVRARRPVLQDVVPRWIAATS